MEAKNSRGAVVVERTKKNSPRRGTERNPSVHLMAGRRQFDGHTPCGGLFRRKCVVVGETLPVQAGSSGFVRPSVRPLADR